MCFAPPMPYFQQGCEATLLLVASSDCSLRVWDADSRRVVAQVQHGASIPHPLRALFTFRAMGPTARQGAARLELRESEQQGHTWEEPGMQGMAETGSETNCSSEAEGAKAALAKQLLPAAPTKGEAGRADAREQMRLNQMPPQPPQLQPWVAFGGCSRATAGAADATGSYFAPDGEGSLEWACASGVAAGASSVGVLAWPLPSGQDSCCSALGVGLAGSVEAVVPSGGAISHAAISTDGSWLVMCSGSSSAIALDPVISIFNMHALF